MSRPKPSSRENGRLSRGPKSQAGKNISKLNGLRHGIFSSDAVLYHDPSGDHLAHTFEAFARAFPPRNDHETALIRKMAEARTRSRRLLYIERLVLSELAKTQPPGTPEDREIGALIQFASEGRAYDTLLRLDNRHRREFDQAYDELLISQGQSHRLPSRAY